MLCLDVCRRFNWEAKLIQDLMHGYNKYARPTMNVSEPIHTTIAFYLTKILGLVSYEPIPGGAQKRFKL